MNETGIRRKRNGSHDRVLLAGPQGRGRELGLAFSVFFEFLRAFRVLHFVGPCVTVFGSARFREGHPHYELARATGGALANEGFTVMTGGGPGVMEAANRGATEAGGVSVGCNIRLPHEQAANRWVDHEVEFEHFFVRKTMLVKYSYAFIVLPGGFGTMDEVFETLTLIQTGKIAHFPVVLMGREYWEPLLDFLRESMVAQGTIAPEDIGLLQIVDDPTEVAERLREETMRRFGLKWGERPARRWWLLER